MSTSEVFAFGAVNIGRVIDVETENTSVQGMMMNPEVEEQAGGPPEKREKTPAKKQHILQRRLKDQISESRMLELLDRQLQGDRANGLRRTNQEEEEELVCVSTMIAVEPSAAAVPEQRVSSVQWD